MKSDVRAVVLDNNVVSAIPVQVLILVLVLVQLLIIQGLPGIGR